MFCVESRCLYADDARVLHRPQCGLQGDPRGKEPLDSRLP